MKKNILLVIALLIGYGAECIASQKGIVIVPVADLIGDPIARLFPNHSPEHAYNHLPWSCYQSHYGANGRLHQLLFHEQVTIISTTKHEVCIEIPHVFYTTRTITTPQTRYWTLKKNIMPFSERIAKQLPPVVSFCNKASVYTPQIAHLLEPWHAKELGITFSAGTRFCIDPSPNNTLLSLFSFNPKTYAITTIHIPRNVLHIQNSSHDQRITDFINICRRWANVSPENIAYVLGGCSYVQTHKNNHFSRIKSTLTIPSLFHYERSQEVQIKTGFDCSNLIVRAAQIAGLPYFYKNTHTAEQRIRSLSENEKIESGDIIWMPGHVLIISDAKKGLCVEAHSYDGGYGIIHELPIETVFKGITSCPALAHAIRTKKTIYRMHQNGKVQQMYTNVKILKLKSIFT